MDAFTSGDLKPSDNPPMASPMTGSVMDASAKDEETGSKKEDAGSKNETKEKGSDEAKDI